MPINTNDPAGGAAAGTGTDPEAGGTTTATPGTDPASAPGAGSPSGTDYEAKIRSDPAFAISEVKSHQSRADKAVGQAQEFNKKLGGLSTYLETHDGDQIAAALQTYTRLVNDPNMKSVMQSYLETGEVKLNGSGSDDDDYRTPEEEAMDSLKQRNQELEQRLQKIEVGTGTEALTRHVEKVGQGLGLSRVQFDKVREDLVKQVHDWQGAGAAGLQAIEGLTGPKGYQTVRSLVLNSLSDDEIHELSAQANSARRNRMAELSTGGPSGLATGPNEPPPKHGSAIEAAIWAADNPDRHESY